MKSSLSEDQVCIICGRPWFWCIHLAANAYLVAAKLQQEKQLGVLAGHAVEQG